MKFGLAPATSIIFRLLAIVQIIEVGKNKQKEI